MVWKLGKRPTFFVPEQLRNQPERTVPSRRCFLPGLRSCQLSPEGGAGKPGRGAPEEEGFHGNLSCLGWEPPSKGSGQRPVCEGGWGPVAGRCDFPPTSLLLDRQMDTA